MTGSAPTNPAGTDAALLAEQRRRARRTALLLGFISLCMYLGFILATGLRS
ncbi:MAG: hypothetical protein ABI567_06915 [Gammaproteobacteria bacterium]